MYQSCFCLEVGKEVLFVRESVSLSSFIPKIVKILTRAPQPPTLLNSNQFHILTTFNIAKPVKFCTVTIFQTCPIRAKWSCKEANQKLEWVN